MRFTGQVRVPEIDHPGVPATIVVEDDQTEVFLEGESLGRWSLFDVHASRLVSSAFSLDLAGEEITFIADEPVDFAYKGVDHMAEVWARYKSMSIPRRVVAVGRSRRGTEPSRIAELREAMLLNLETAVRTVPRLAPIETVRDMAPVAPPEIVAPPFESSPFAREPAIPPDPVPVFRPSPVELDPPIESAPAAETVSPIVEDRAAPPSPPTAPLRPGPGLISRIAPQPGERVEEGVADSEPEPITPELGTPRSGSPWDEPGPAEEPVPVLDREAVFAPEPIVDEPGEAPTPIPPSVSEPVAPEEVAEPVATDDAAPPAPPVLRPEVPEMVKELLSTSTDEGGEGGARDLVVDLGQYEGRDRRAPPPGEPEPPAQEPVFAGAPTVTPERGGLLGAVRSAFARNKVPHEHVFVEAPGGIGIVRQICAECGYISIGLSD